MNLLIENALSRCKITKQTTKRQQRSHNKKTGSTSPTISRSKTTNTIYEIVIFFLFINYFFSIIASSNCQIVISIEQKNYDFFFVFYLFF